MAIIKRAIGTVGVMWQDVVSTQFLHSICPALIYSQHALCGKHEYIHYHWARASYHELGRTELVDNAVGDWLWSTDTDHQFAPDILERLLFFKNREKAQVISGVYTYKNPPYAPVANMWGENDTVVPLAAWDPKLDVIKVGPVGGGCLIVDLPVFTRIKRELRQAPFHIIQGLSEDYSFCKRLKKLDIPVHLALKVESHHLAPRNVLHIGDYVEQFKPAFENMQRVMEEEKAKQAAAPPPPTEKKPSTKARSAGSSHTSPTKKEKNALPGKL